MIGWNDLTEFGQNVVICIVLLLILGVIVSGW